MYHLHVVPGHKKKKVLLKKHWGGGDCNWIYLLFLQGYYCLIWPNLVRPGQIIGNKLPKTSRWGEGHSKPAGGIKSKSVPAYVLAMSSICIGICPGNVAAIEKMFYFLNKKKIA